MPFNKTKSLQKDLYHQKLPDVHQSWWQLAAIQLTGVTSLPILTGSVLIAMNSNFLSAIVTLALANIILWFIRYKILSMSFQGRKSAIDLTQEYFGKTGTFFIAILFLISTIAWFVMQTNLSSQSLSELIPIKQKYGINHFMQIGVLIGILSTIFCLNGIVIIRWVSMISLPILIISFLGIIFSSHSEIPIKMQSGLNISGLPILLGSNLAITIDMPTFFRHSNSKNDSYRALTTIQILSFLIGIGGVFLGSIIEPWLGIKTDNQISHNLLLKNFLIIFIFVSAICANISNVYSSSVGWELVAPIFSGRKEYLILGLSLSIIFILITNVFSIDILADITDLGLVNLSFIFVIGYLFLNHPLNKLEKASCFFAWIFSTIINTLQFFNIILYKYSTLLISIIIIFLTIGIFLCFQLLFTRKIKEKNHE